MKGSWSEIEAVAWHGR